MAYENGGAIPGQVERYGIAVVIDPDKPAIDLNVPTSTDGFRVEIPWATLASSVNSLPGIDLANAVVHMFPVIEPSDHERDQLLEDEPAPIKFGGDLWVIDPASRVVSIKGDPVYFPKLEFDIMYSVALRVGKAVTRRELIITHWGGETPPEKHRGAFGVRLSAIRKRFDAVSPGMGDIDKGILVNIRPDAVLLKE